MRPRLRLCVLLSVGALSGCGESGPQLGKVSGQVLLDGAPVTDGTVRFWPQQGRPAQGELDAEGRFEMSTFDPGDGALVGDHRVTIEAMTTEGYAPEVNSLEQEMEVFADRSQAPVRAQRVKWIVPERYGHPSSSGLTATVESGKNEINFPLESQSP